MELLSIKADNFRNLVNVSINNFDKVNILKGDNAQGKSNFLELIYFLNYYKSFRTNNINDLIKLKSNYFNINCDILNLNVKNNLNIYYKDKKIVKLNKKSVNFKNIYNNIKTILYYPYEINYLLVNSSSRRNLIDRSIFLLKSEYIYKIKKYNKILKNRNIFLKKNKNEFDPWIEQLIFISKDIIEERHNFIKRINNKFYNLYFSKNFEENYKINYKYEENENIECYLRDRYLKVKDKEFICGYTLIGPHLDNISFYINDKNIKNHSSEGQKKYFILNYKYAQLIDYYEINKSYPILLFDDLTSELDSKRRNIYIEKIIESSGQIFITSTGTDITLPIPFKLMNVSNGIVK